MALVIKKRVSLEFLGDEYKEAYLIFQSIPALDYAEIQNQIEETQKDNSKSLNYMIQTLEKYFLAGKFPDDNNELQDVKAEDLKGLDPDSLIKCFQIFTGQVPDPKAEKPLTSSSPTVETPQ